jgi:hypothetical protein
MLFKLKCFLSIIMCYFYFVCLYILTAKGFVALRSSGFPVQNLIRNTQFKYNTKLNIKHIPRQHESCYQDMCLFNHQYTTLSAMSLKLSMSVLTLSNLLVNESKAIFPNGNRNGALSNLVMS